MDISNVDVASVVQELVNEGRLSSPLVLDNTVIRVNGTPVVTQIATQFADNGWATNNFSVLGGRESAAMNNIFSYLRNAGHNDVLPFLRKYHVGFFWTTIDGYRGWSMNDPQRFPLPTAEQLTLLGYTQDQLNQVTDNVWNLMNNEFRLAVMSSSAVANMYRGELGKNGFSPVVAGTDNLNFSPAPILDPVHNPYSNTNPYQTMNAQHISRQTHKDAFGNPSSVFARVPDGPVFTDHAVYDRWFDMQSDEAPARFALSWLNSVGIAIPMNPVGFRTSPNP